MNIRQEACGGFIVSRGESEIEITHPGGKWSLLSSSYGGGYTEAPDKLVLTGKGVRSGQFSIRTSSDIENASLISRSHGMTSVSALVIADPDPQTPRSVDKGYGISIVLMVDAALPTATMARAAVTSTEAVTCAFQQLMIGRPDSKEIASGSDSVCIAVLSNTERGITLHNAGKHSKLGELIGRAVIEATLSSMGKNGVTPESQADIFKRLERFGITKGSCEEYLVANGLEPGKGFGAAIEKISCDKVMLSCVSSILHIEDEISWGLIPEDEGYEAGREIICAVISKDAPGSKDLIADIVSAVSMKALKEG